MNQTWDGKMAQMVKAPTDKADGMSSSPRLDMVEKINDFHKLSSDLPGIHCSRCKPIFLPAPQTFINVEN